MHGWLGGWMAHYVCSYCVVSWWRVCPVCSPPAEWWISWRSRLRKAAVGTGAYWAAPRYCHPTQQTNTYYADRLHLWVLEQEFLTKHAHTTVFYFLKLQCVTTATGSLRELSYGMGFNRKCVIVVPQRRCGCSSGPAGVCEGLTAGGGSVMEPPSVSGTDWTAVYHCSSPVRQTHAPAWTNTEQKERKGEHVMICDLIFFLLF